MVEPIHRAVPSPLQKFKAVAPRSLIGPEAKLDGGCACTPSVIIQSRCLDIGTLRACYAKVRPDETPGMCPSSKASGPAL